MVDLAEGVLPDDHSYGAASALVTMVEYADFDCRFSDRDALVAAIMQARSSATPVMCARGYNTIVEALAGLLAVTSSLRDAYKQHYWRCLPLPFAHSRMICGQHAREQSELAAHLSQRAQLVENASSATADSTIERLNSEGPTPSVAELEPWFERLLMSHEYALTTAHSVANRLAQLGDAESRRWVAGQLVMVNERQAETIARRILAARRDVSRVTER
jgi:hypothetical protein